jgi:hypothetical protein
MATRCRTQTVKFLPFSFATDIAARHTESWQQNGTLYDTFRLDILLPLL